MLFVAHGTPFVPVASTVCIDSGGHLSIPHGKSAQQEEKQMGWMKDETGLEKCSANHVALTPLSHLRRAAHVFPDRLAIVYHGHRK
ncbi:MAG: hypothetical protein ACNA7M_15790, partial [Roseovarius sp.]